MDNINTPNDSESAIAYDDEGDIVDVLHDDDVSTVGYEEKEILDKFSYILEQMMSSITTEYSSDPNNIINMLPENSWINYNKIEADLDETRTAIIENL